MSLEDFEMVHDLDNLYRDAQQYVKGLECDMECQHMLTGKGMYEEQMAWLHHIWLTLLAYREAYKRAKESIPDVPTQQSDATQEPGCQRDGDFFTALLTSGDC